MKATIALLNPEHQQIAENLLRGFAEGAVDVTAIDGAVYCHGEIKETNKTYLEQAFTDTNNRFCGGQISLALGA